MAVTDDFRTFQQMEDPFPPPTGTPCSSRARWARVRHAAPPSDGGTRRSATCSSPPARTCALGQAPARVRPARRLAEHEGGPGPSPLETDEGWLLIYHGVWTSCNGFLYYAGGALLDLEKPWKVIARTRDYLLGPTMPYERVGDVPNVVFPSAMVTFPETNTMRIYYGCADTCVSMAEADIGEVIAFIREHSL